MPPDLEKRKEIVRDNLKKGNFTPEELDKMARDSVYLGYEAIVGAIGTSVSSASDIAKRMADAERSCSHKHYLSRLTLETTFPDDEFVEMVGLASQAGKKSAVNKDIKLLDPDAKKAWEELFRKSPDLIAKLSKLEDHT